MKKNSFSYDDLISCGNGQLFGPGNAKLPLPPMLMFDRITKINENEGSFKKGLIKEGTTVGLANGILMADGKKIYSAENLKVGLFKQ